MKPLIFVLMVFSACSSRQPPPTSPIDAAPRLVLSLEHLETRTSSTSANLVFQNFPEGVDGQAVIAGLAPGVHVDTSGGEAVNASVELFSGQYGNGLLVAWDQGLPEGWYQIVVPSESLPVFVNHQAWHQSEKEGSVWFRIGSEPIVRSVVRLRQGKNTFFEVVFSEPLRAETSTVNDLVALFDGETRLSCRGVQSMASNEPVDFTHIFDSFVLLCEGEALTATRAEVMRFVTPEGTPVGTLSGGSASLLLDWSNAVPLEGGLSEQWFEPGLPAK